MLDKPPITEKLTNAWHLLNIHYSDNSSEFQRAERMLNQHSYSQSEPPHHIAARLSADENGTLGPDSRKKKKKKEKRSGAPHQGSASAMCVCACVKGRQCLCLWGRHGWHLTFQAISPKNRGICPLLFEGCCCFVSFPHPPTTTALRPWQPYEEWAEWHLEEWEIITTKFIHNIAQGGHRRLARSLLPFFLALLEQTFFWGGQKGVRAGVPSTPKGSGA